MTERTTPETDEASFSTVYQGELVKASFARRLERQRDELLEALENLLQHRPRADWEGLTIAEGLTWDDAEELIAAAKGGKP
jgi:hypothetical protein